MHLVPLLLVYVAGLCADTRLQAGLLEDHFPVPKQGLAIPPPAEGGPSLLGVLDDFARVTGQKLQLSEHARERLAKTATGLTTAVEVPPAEVYSVVESLLWQNHFVLIDERGTEPRMLAVKSLESPDRAAVRLGCVTVPAERIALYKRHPALMIQTVIELPGVDVRALANSMRMLFVDADTQQMVPIESSVILVGTGRTVAAMAEMLKAVAAGAKGTEGGERQGAARRAGEDGAKQEQEPR
jgi:hypothetical protein